MISNHLAPNVTIGTVGAIIIYYVSACFLGDCLDVQ